MPWVKKALLAGAVIGLVAGGVALIPRKPQTAEARGYRMTLVGYTNAPADPHAVFLLQTPKGGGRWHLWEVRYREEGDWKPWMSPPIDYMIQKAGPNQFASLSVPATNVPLRVVMAIYEERREGMVSRVQRWWAEREYKRKHGIIHWERMPTYLMTNESTGVVGAK